MLSIAFKRQFLLAVLCALTLSGCATLTSTSVPIDAPCTVWQPLTWSVKDTNPTIIGIKTNNVERASWCGKH